MKKFTLLAAILLLGSASPAFAFFGPTKFMGWIWWPSHWYNQDFQPYYENVPEPHNSQWDDNKLNESEWTPKEWVDLDGGVPIELVRKWYVADILRDQDFNASKPYVVVGPNFYHLGGADKHRVMETLDAIFKVTQKSKAHAFYLEDFRTDQVVGIYSKDGLDLQ